MTTKDKLYKLYDKLRDEFGIECNCLNIRISKRLRSANGYVKHYHMTKEATIVMSEAVLKEFGWKRFEQIFRHEVAHILCHEQGGRGHDKLFKMLCAEMGGTMNERMAGKEYSWYASTEFVKPIVKWIYTCPCGYEKKMSKRMSYKKRGKLRYKCGICRIHHLDTWTERKV